MFRAMQTCPAPKLRPHAELSEGGRVWVSGMCSTLVVDTLFL